MENVIGSLIYQIHPSVDRSIRTIIGEDLMKDPDDIYYMGSYDNRSFLFLSQMNFVKQNDIYHLGGDYVLATEEKEKLILDFFFHVSFWPLPGDVDTIQDIIYNCQAIANYKLERMENEILSSIKTNLKQVAEEITFIPLKINAAFEENELRRSLKTDLKINMEDIIDPRIRGLKIRIICDMVHEMDYEIEGKFYEKARRDFEIRNK